MTVTTLPMRRTHLKLIRWIILASCLLNPAATLAEGMQDCRPRNESLNLITDVLVIRPVGAAATLAGAALFVATSPFTALASIPEPHNAFDRVGSLLVGTPYAYTFVRPLGYFSTSCY